MPLTPAKRHYQKATAQDEAASAADPAVPTNANQYELMLIQLAEHKRRLKQIQSVEQKAAVKQEILSEYEAYVDGVMLADTGSQDDVLMTVMVWRIDAGDLTGALVIGDYALDHGLKTPEQYKRTTATLLAEEVAETALRNPDQVSAEMLLQTEALTHDHDMVDQVRAKLHKSIGVKLTDSDKTTAIEHLERALELNKNSGVKKMIEALKRDLKNQ